VYVNYNIWEWVGASNNDPAQGLHIGTPVEQLHSGRAVVAAAWMLAVAPTRRYSSPAWTLRAPGPAAVWLHGRSDDEPGADDEIISPFQCLVVSPVGVERQLTLLKKILALLPPIFWLQQQIAHALLKPTYSYIMAIARHRPVTLNMHSMRWLNQIEDKIIPRTFCDASIFFWGGGHSPKYSLLKPRVFKSFSISHIL